MKSITFFIGSLTGGGAERVTCNLANYLANKGDNIEVLTMSDVKDAYILNDKVKRTSLITTAERKNAVFNFLVRFHRLSKYMKKHKEVDCYIVMLPVTIAMMLLLRKKTKAKIIVSERNDPSTYKQMMQKMQRYLAKRADGFVFQTEDAMKWYEGAIDSCYKTIIPNAINPEFIVDRYTGKREKKIVSVCRLNEQKNVPLLINAFLQISDEYPDYKLVIYGQGPKKNEIENLIAVSGKDDRIELPGYTECLREKIIDASLFVLSSDYEGMPNALIEAMALGLPCVSTDCPVGGPRYLIQDGVSGILVPVGDVDEMTKAISKLLSDECLRNSIACKAAGISERLAPDKIYGKWDEYIYNVICR